MYNLKRIFIEKVMEETEKNKSEKIDITDNIFPLPDSLDDKKETIHINTKVLNSKVNMMQEAFKFHSKGNIIEAARCYQNFIKQGLLDHNVFSNFGSILKDLGKLKEAEIYTRKAIKLKPDFAIGYSNLGNILRDLGKLKEAEIYTRKAIELNPYYSGAYLKLGRILKDLSKFKEAEVSLLKTIELKPNSAENYYIVSKIFTEMNNLDQSLKLIEKAIELDPKNHIYTGELTRIKFIKEDHD